MEPIENSGIKNQIVNTRVRFLLEVIFIFIGIFLFLLIPLLLIPFMIDEESVLFGPIYYATRALVVFLAIPISLFILNLVSDLQNQETIREERLTPSFSH